MAAAAGVGGHGRRRSYSFKYRRCLFGASSTLLVRKLTPQNQMGAADNSANYDGSDDVDNSGTKTGASTPGYRKDGGE